MSTNPERKFDAEEKLYVVVHEYSSHKDNPDRPVWTVSFDPDEEGWTTDCGHPGYGLTKPVAEEIARRYNEFNKAYAQGVEDGKWKALEASQMGMKDRLSEGLPPMDSNTLEGK